MKLLKEGKEIPADLDQQIKEGKMKEAEEKDKVEGLNTELSTLKDKVIITSVIKCFLAQGYKKNR